MFITIEGANGVGKSTVIKELCKKLENEKLSYFLTKEPTNSILGNFAKKSESDLKGISYACLIASDRYYHIETEIIPSLNSYNVIISDRYVESSLVLQALDGVDRDFIWSINSKVLVPDLSIILFGNDKIIKTRIDEREILSRFEKNYTRKQEQDLYLSVFNFIKEKKFNAVLIENTDEKIDKTINAIYELIQNFRKKIK